MLVLEKENPFKHGYFGVSMLDFRGVFVCPFKVLNTCKCFWFGPGQASCRLNSGIIRLLRVPNLKHDMDP